MNTDTTNMEGVQDRGHMVQENVSHLKKIAQLSILDSFSKLESGVESYRVAAGLALLRSLFQKQHESEDEDTCRELNYALKRLIRSLCTSNPNKRAGFFSVLVEMVNLFPNITVQNVLEIMGKELEAGTSFSKKEITEAYVGRVMVIGALIHSNKILEEAASSQVEILGKLLAAGKKKNVLFPSINSFLIDFIHKSDVNHFKEVLWPTLKPEVNKSWEQQTLDTLHLLIEMRKKFPDVVKKKFLLQSLGSKEVISESSITSCAKLLMNSYFENHPVYEEIFQRVCLSNFVISFWEALTKENELHRNRNKEEPLLKFLELLLQHMTDKSQIPELLCDSFMEVIIKILETKKIKANLAKKACELFTKMSHLLENNEIDDDVRVSFIERLLFYPGHLMFDKLAGTKIVCQLSSHMKTEAIEKITGRLRDVICIQTLKVKNSQGETGVWSKWERSYAAQLLTRILSLPVMEENIKWKLKQLKFLISIGFFISQSSEPGDLANIAVATEVRNCIFRVLDQKVSKIDQLVTLLSSIAYHINGILYGKKNPSKLRQPLSESASEAWKKMIAVVKEIESTEENAILGKQSSKNMFLILFLHMGLQLLQNTPLAEEALPELHSCYERIKNEDLQLEEKKVKSVDGEEEEEPYWVEVFVDLFLSLLSRNLHLLRSIVGVVFPHLCAYLTPTSVHQILQVLNPLEKQPLSSTDTEGDDEDSDDENEAKVPEKEAESGSDDDDDDDDDDYEDESGNAPVDAHLKLAVQNALKKVGGGYGGSDEESVDMDEMTDEQRKGLDTALSEAFKLLKHNQAEHKRKKQSKDDETIMHFRVRVLDLIDIYLTNQPALALILDIILPLFELLEFCIRDDHQKPLQNRVRSSIKKLSSVKHFSNVEGVDQELLSVVLGHLLQKGERAAAVYQNMGEPLVQCSMFLARTSSFLEQQQKDGPSKKNSPVLDIFEEALTSFFKQRDSLLPLDVFKAVLAIAWKGAWSLATAILGFAFDSAVRPFRRHQALELLGTFYSSGRHFAEFTPKCHKKLAVLEEKLSQSTVELLNQIVDKKEKNDATPDVKEKYVKELFCLLYAVWHARNRSQANGVPTAVDWEAVKTAVSRYWGVMSFKQDTSAALRKLAAALKINLSQKGRIEGRKKLSQEQCDLLVENEKSDEEEKVMENGDDSDDEEENGDEGVADSDEDTGDKGYESGNDEKDVIEEEGTKKRKKRKVDNLKGKAILKKQTKEARLASMAEGLDTSFSFTGVNIEELPGGSQNVELEDKSESNVNRKKKRKHFGDREDLHNNENELSEISKKPKVKRKDRAAGSLPKRKKLKIGVN